MMVSFRIYTCEKWHCLFPSAVNVRLDAGTYAVAEDVGSLEVCANLESPNTPGSGCPVNFAVQVSLTSSDGTAGMLMVQVITSAIRKRTGKQVFCL